jgi:hypothetical protein
MLYIRIMSSVTPSLTKCTCKDCQAHNARLLRLYGAK